MTRLPYIIRKEFIQIRRDPLTIRLIMVAPIFQLILFGYAATSDVHHVKVMVCDADRSPESRRITRRSRAATTSGWSASWMTHAR